MRTQKQGFLGKYFVVTSRFNKNPVSLVLTISYVSQDLRATTQETGFFANFAL
jgi:hypothetical protein